MGRSRRRRKRLLQEEKGSSAKKWLLRSIFILLGVFILLVVGTYIYALNYLKSEEFRSTLEKKAGESIQSNITLSPIQRDGRFFRVDHIDILGHNQVIDIASINEIDVEIDYDKLWDRTVHLKRIAARKVEATLIQPPLTSSASDSTAPQVEVIEEAPSDSASPWYSSYLPNKYEFENISIEKLTLSTGTPLGAVALRGTSVSINHTQDNNDYYISLNRGNFQIPWDLFPMGKLNKATIRFRNPRINVTELEAQVGTQGKLTLEGTYNLNNEPLSINLGLRQIELSEILPPDWLKSVSGSINLYCKISGGKETPYTYKGNAAIDNGILTALPILDTLAAFTGTSRFRRIEWTTAKADYLKEGSRWEISNIFLASEGLVRIQGNLIIDGENLSGDLMVGLPAGILSHIPGAEEEVFLPSTDSSRIGLLWAPVKISGTLSNPKEDLSNRLITAAGERLFRIIPGGKKVLNFTRSIADHLIDQITPEDEKQKENTDKTPPGIKQGQDLLNSGLQMGLDILAPVD